MATTSLLTEKQRISSIDIIRGIVMVIMALDHCRDFFHADASIYDPTDMTKTSVVVFFTRWITHFCAPTFVLLSGTAIRISQQRKSKKELSLFLLTRGLWLILLEVVGIRFSFFFNFYYDATIFQVIWVIGASMVVMAALIHLPARIILILGVIITLGHNILDLIRLDPQSNFYGLWTFLYQAGFIQLTPNNALMVMYPLLPWLGIMMMGYCLGSWFTKEIDSSHRQKLLFRAGWITIVLFIVLRFINVYGDIAPWAVQKNAIFTFMSFLNCSKYPPSLLYISMTLGPVLVLLGWMETRKLPALSPFIVFGRVPLFYYILHFYLIHATALSLYMIIQHKSFADIDLHFAKSFGGLPPGANGYSLFWAYVAWISVVTILYPVCKWYNQYKSTHQQWWLSYL